jgi:hypothetical protein
VPSRLVQETFQLTDISDHWTEDDVSVIPNDESETITGLQMQILPNIFGDD